MPGQATKRQRQDEDTDLGNKVHKTNQVSDQTEQAQDDSNQPQNDTGRRGSEKDVHAVQKGKKVDRGNRR
jgi:hypothetical protein